MGEFEVTDNGELDLGVPDSAAFEPPAAARRSALRRTGDGEQIPAGFLHHQQGRPSGAGFAAGGELDTLAPGPLLSEAVAAAAGDGHDQLGESELIGVLCAWRRISSWAAAGQAAAVLALDRRRAVQSDQTGRPHLSEHVGDELSAALTLTGRSADRLLSLSRGLRRLDDVHAALERGEIDWAKACVFIDELGVLASDQAARQIAARLLGRAGPGGWTTGQLRTRLRQAVLAADPDAAVRRRREARADADVESWDESSANAALAGRELPPAQVTAAMARLTALARWLHDNGAPGTIGQLRAAAYIALLADRPVESLLPGLTGGDREPGRSAARGYAVTRFSGRSSWRAICATDAPMIRICKTRSCKAAVCASAGGTPAAPSERCGSPARISGVYYHHQRRRFGASVEVTMLPTTRETT